MPESSARGSLNPRAHALVVGLDSASATFESCGGKGINLVRLRRGGFPVPPGFIVVTDAYRRFVAANHLAKPIADAVAGLDPSDPAALEAASSRIREVFVAGEVPDDVSGAVRTAWAQVFPADAAVAVRSSATAEDLPDLSFAGQQDTFLNVVGINGGLRAVVECWASLWTARAIGYRLRNDIPDEGLALAVVVQELVPAEASGVLFTANPVTGVRDEVVIDATWGLGEALVSGQVEPDHFVVDGAGHVTATLGAKAVATTPLAGGGVETRPSPADERPTLTTARAGELARLGRAVAEHFGSPQDIEWAIADGTVQLLQSRAITSLFPVPGDDPDALYFSFGAVQGMLQPITPLGRDAIGFMLSGVTALVGKRFDLAAAGLLLPAGERLWIRVDRVLRHPIGGRILPRALPLVEPGAAAVVAEYLADRGLRPRPGPPSAATLRGLASIAGVVLPHVPRSLFDPAGRRRAFDADMLAFVEEAARRQATASAVRDPWRRFAARLRTMQETLAGAFPALLRCFAPIMLPAMAMLTRLQDKAAAGGDRGRVLAMEVLRGLPGNVTTQMDLALWEAASAIRDDAAAAKAFGTLTADVLAERLASGELPGAARAAVEGFLTRYGMRGVGEIDLGQARWRENPVDVLHTLQSYLRITDPELAPDAVFARGRQAAEAATEELAVLLGNARLVRFQVSRLRSLIGARETPKFTMVQLLGLVREGLLASGADLVALGVLDRADDVFHLHFDELGRLASEPSVPWREVVTARRQVAERERRRRQVPRMIAGDGHAYYEGVGHSGAGLGGSPVSPGVAEGPVRVVFDPQATQLLPGEILVCPGTDPAWTPLFLTAGGLVTEVGGMMTHGSVVAREYGIPAVVGVHEATTRLHTGQRIRLDGGTGAIELLDDAPTG